MWHGNRILAQTSCLAILRPETMRKLLARRRKAHSLYGHNANLAFTAFSTSSLKAHGCQDTLLPANFLQDVAACFSAEKTLTTLSKRSLKCLALERVTYKNFKKTHIKTSSRRIREWKGVIVSRTTAFPFPPPRVCISPLLIMRHTVWPPLPPWVTKSIIPAD